MAEEHQGSNINDNVESTDRGLFDFMKKNKEDDHDSKDECHQEQVVAAEFEQKVEVSEEDKEGGLLHKLHRSDSSSSSSSDEEEGDDEEKKKRKKEKKEKKGLKEKIKEKLPGHHKDEEDTNVPIEKVHVEEVVYSEPSHPHPAPAPAQEEAEAEKKGLLEKIKDKLPGQYKKAEGEHEAAPVAVPEGECQEKKGFLDKIKEKIPGFHSKAPEEDKNEVDKRD